MSKSKQMKQAWAECKQSIADIKIKHDVAEWAIRKKIGEMTLVEFESNMKGDMAIYWKIAEGMGGIRRTKICHYALKRYWKLRKDERRKL